MKSFDIPILYRSPLITAIKGYRKQQDKLKKDFSPTRLDLGQLNIYLARHFGFCYGVENAIEIAYRTLEENPGRNIFLLSEMIHNPQVNADLQDRGIRFLQDTLGKQLIPLTSLSREDIVIIPAFGTTLTMEKQLRDKGIAVEQYNTTCPFVEKVWNRSEQIAAKGYTIIIHGKPNHEETRATFSHAAATAPTVIVNDMEEAVLLSDFIRQQKPATAFFERFQGKYSPGFQPSRDLMRIGVVNQTTQLASDTQAIADFLKQTMREHFQLDDSNIEQHFAETRDTLCYATNDNQTAVSGMLETPADLALVIGGYNSSNTTHLVELCEERLPSYFINNEGNLIDESHLESYDRHSKKMIQYKDYLPKKDPVNILITSGASCPDALVEGVIRKLAGFYGVENKLERAVESLTAKGS
jgi:4-hydroxy-3-methylbut-2-enyl diphosphate reductase